MLGRGPLQKQFGGMSLALTSDSFLRNIIRTQAKLKKLKKDFHSIERFTERCSEECEKTWLFNVVIEALFLPEKNFSHKD